MVSVIFCLYLSSLWASSIQLELQTSCNPVPSAVLQPVADGQTEQLGSQQRAAMDALHRPADGRRVGCVGDQLFRIDADGAHRHADGVRDGRRTLTLTLILILTLTLTLTLILIENCGHCLCFGCKQSLHAFNNFQCFRIISSTCHTFCNLLNCIHKA